MSAEATLATAVSALRAGRVDEAVIVLEGLADRGVMGAGVAVDRGLAYAARARSVQAVPGDLGRAAHAFEEALRLDPRDAEAQAALDAIRQEIARRNAQAGGRAEEVDTPPVWRAVVASAPADAWAVLALAGSMALSAALLVRPRLQRGLRLAASTTALVGLFVSVTGAVMGLGARHLHRHVHEAVVVTAQAVAIPDGGGRPIDLAEGARVDVLEQRASTTRVRTSRGEGWVARDALRTLPAWQP